MQSPIQPLHPRAIRIAKTIWWVTFLGGVALMVGSLMQEGTITLEGNGPHGRMSVEMDVKGDLNGFLEIMKGDGLWRKHVHKIRVIHRSRLGNWVTEDPDLKSFAAPRDYAVSSGGLRFLSDEGANKTQEVIIGLPDRKNQTTWGQCHGSGDEQRFELAWDEEK